MWQVYLSLLRAQEKCISEPIRHSKFKRRSNVLWLCMHTKTVTLMHIPRQIEFQLSRFHSWWINGWFFNWKNCDPLTPRGIHSLGYIFELRTQFPLTHYCPASANWWAFIILSAATYQLILCAIWPNVCSSNRSLPLCAFTDSNRTNMDTHTPTNFAKCMAMCEGLYVSMIWLQDPNWPLALEKLYKPTHTDHQISIFY